MLDRTCTACGGSFHWEQSGRGRPRSKCFECSPPKSGAYIPVERDIRPCVECGTEMAAFSWQKFCSDSCRYRSRDRENRVPCAVCGEPMYLGSTSFPDGQARHQRCMSRTPDGELIHGRAAYSGHGCRCDECRAASSAAVREWTRKNKYWSKPDVVARRKELRSTQDARDAEKRRWGRYYRENREQLIVAAKVQDVRRKGAPTIQFTLQQLEDRLSMFDGCWMCGCSLGGGFHIDHVKPLSKGGWHCLSNLRPSCPSCNLSKGAKWPLEKVMLTV